MKVFLFLAFFVFCICGPVFCTTEISLTKISQVALVVKNLTANEGDVRGAGLIRDWEDPLDESIATHSSILSYLENPMGRRTWKAYSP